MQIYVQKVEKFIKCTEIAKKKKKSLVNQIIESLKKMQNKVLTTEFYVI